MRNVLPVVLFAFATIACGGDSTSALKYADLGDAHLAKKEYAEARLQYLNAIQADPDLGRAHLNLARAYVAVDDYREAYVEYRRAADLLPDDIDVQAEVGNILLLGRFFNEAKERARKILEKPENRNHLGGLLLLGNALAGLQDLESAVEVTESAIQASPDRGGTYANLGTLQLARGNRAEAEKAFRQAVSLDPKSVSARLSLANFYRAVGQLDATEQQLKEAVAIDTTNFKANRALAAFYTDTNLASRAEPYMRRVAEVRNDPESWLDLASLLLSLKKPSEALQALEKISTNSKNYVTARTRMAMVTHAAGKTKEAHAIIAEILKQIPNEPRALATDAELLVAERRLDDAYPKARDAVQMAPNVEEGHFALARVYLAREQLEAARQSLSEVLRLDPSRLDAMVELSRVHARRNELDSATQVAVKAVQLYPFSVPARIILVEALTRRPESRPRAFQEIQNLVAQYPGSPEARSALGSYYLAINDEVAARREFERALAIDPSYRDALIRIVALDMSAGRLIEAHRRLREEFDKHPEDPMILMLTAKVALAEGQLPEAEFMLRRLIGVDETNLEAYSLLGRLYVGARRLPAATQAFIKIVERDQQSSSAHTMLGLLYHAQGKLPEAISHYEKAFAANPDSATAANNLAWILAENDQSLERALQLAQSARAQLPNDPTITDTLGWVLLKRDMLSLALSTLQDAVRMAPDNALFTYHLGVAYAKAGEDNKARKALERALMLDPKFPKAEDARKILSRLVY
jgi:tetratricopeptide (TPR) repeat protein